MIDFDVEGEDDMNKESDSEFDSETNLRDYMILSKKKKREKHTRNFKYKENKIRVIEKSILTLQEREKTTQQMQVRDCDLKEKVKKLHKTIPQLQIWKKKLRK